MTNEQINMWGVYDSIRQAQAAHGDGAAGRAIGALRQAMQFVDGVETPKAIHMANELEQTAQELGSGAPQAMRNLARLALEVQGHVPDFRIVLLEETSDWDESVRSQAGRIFSAYLYDARRATHLAELQPSYELHHLYTTAENSDLPDDVEEALLVNGGPEEGSIYMHVRAVDALPWERKSVCSEPADTVAETYGALVEAEIESYRGSVDIQLPRPLDAQLGAFYAQRLIERGAMDEANELVDAMPQQEREVVLGAAGSQREAEYLTKGLDALVKHLDAQRAATTAAQAPEGRAEKASRFFNEVLAEYESLGLLADYFGTSTLADVTYMMSSIIEGVPFEVWPRSITTSRIDEVVAGLPSRDEWLENLKFVNKYGEQLPRSRAQIDAPDESVAPSI